MENGKWKDGQHHKHEKDVRNKKMGLNTQIRTTEDS